MDVLVALLAPILSYICIVAPYTITIQYMYITSYSVNPVSLLYTRHHNKGFNTIRVVMTKYSDHHLLIVAVVG